MAHQRTVIRNAVVALLLGQTAAASRVYAARRAPSLRKNELPAICVYTDEEDSDTGQSAPRELEREVDLLVVAFVMPDDDADAAMDDIALQVETAMHADPYLPLKKTVTAADLGTDRLTIAAHGYVAGQGPLRPASSGVLPSGLSGGGLGYYVIVVDPDTIQLAASPEDAVAAVAVDLKAAGTGTLVLTQDSCMDSFLAGTAKVDAVEGDRDVGIVSLTYRVTYRTFAPEAPAGLDDFERVETKYQQPGSHPGNAPEDIFTVEAP